MNAIRHFMTITHHKLLVMAGCFRIGLYKQGLLHDLSKYTPTEFLVGCRYYKGYMSPNNAERADKGYSAAWLHHKGRNKHHLEYWIDYAVPKPGEDIHTPMEGMKMPIKYVCEMFIDRVSASKNYQKEKLGNTYTFPSVSICDPTYTYSVSQYQTAAGSADIMSHIFEGYFSRTMDSDLADGIAGTQLDRKSVV